MSEQRMETVTGFGRREPETASWQGFAWQEIENRRIWWLACGDLDQPKLSSAIEKTFGFTLPGACRFEERGETVLAWFGPGQWFAMLGERALPARLGKHAATAEMSDGWVGLWLTGGATRSVLEKLCSLDLDASAFRAGHCARTLFEGMAVLLLCLDDAEARYALFTPRSSAQSLLHHLDRAARSACGEPLSMGEADPAA